MHSSPSYSLYDLFSCHSAVSQTSSTDTGGERGKAFLSSRGQQLSIHLLVSTEKQWLYLELIGMLSYGTASQEEKFKPQFNITGHAKEDTFLHISSISVEDSAIYFCAASLHSHTVPFKR